MMDKKPKGLSRNVKTTTNKQKGFPRLTAKPEAGLKRHLSPPLAPPPKASTHGAVRQGHEPLADTTATVNVRSESAISREPGTNAYRMTNAAVAEVKFPRCDAAVRTRDGSEWELADAILAECCEPGEDGVRNESYAQMEAMRQEIAANHGVQLSFERIRKLRKVASAFPPGRRRPGVSLEGHLEAGTPEALGRFRFCCFALRVFFSSTFGRFRFSDFFGGVVGR
jgi:hypothetical protein